MVDAHLEARDGAGQMGVSKTVTFRLPRGSSPIRWRAP